MILGMHDMLDAMAHYWETRVSSEGALWIVMMDGLFLIPLIFALFFYPRTVLLGVGAVVLLSLVLLEIVHVARTHRLGGWRRS
jgi:hypothetical protein